MKMCVKKSKSATSVEDCAELAEKLADLNWTSSSKGCYE